MPRPLVQSPPSFFLLLEQYYPALFTKEVCKDFLQTVHILKKSNMPRYSLECLQSYKLTDVFKVRKDEEKWTRINYDIFYAS